MAIPATTPIPAGADYDLWTPVQMAGEYLSPGVFRVALTLRPSRAAGAGNTELHPDRDRAVQVIVENVYGAAAMVAGAAAVGAARGVL